jgi:drug/metabolite transporter (DMT)-like permease
LIIAPESGHRPGLFDRRYPQLVRVVLVLTLATFSGAVGQIFLRRGMQIIGSLESYAPLDLIAYFLKALTQPHVIGGTALSAIGYFCLLAALSWTGVTVAFPLTSLEYGFAAILAVMILKEAVPPLRWMGIACVILGVILISASGENESGKGKIRPREINQPEGIAEIDIDARR